MEQMKNFTKTFLKGDSQEVGIFRQAVKGVAATLFPHGG